MTIYTVTFNGSDIENGSIVDRPVTIACFFTRQSAEEFAKVENDELQANIHSVDQYDMIDKYGFPMSAREWPEIYGRRIGE